MTLKDDRVYLGHMIEIAHKALSFVDGISRDEFDHDETLRLALTHLIQIIGESARRVSPEFRATYPQIPLIASTTSCLANGFTR